MEKVILTDGFKEELAYITENFIEEAETYAKENAGLIEHMGKELTVSEYIESMTSDNDEGSFSYDYLAPAVYDEFSRQKGIDDERAFEERHGEIWQSYYDEEIVDFFIECDRYAATIFENKGY